ncbi:hemin uptake protein HemP [Martelella radicis]|uniref:Hemin uptake protein HemP n=1 Tax=Martelella radicis TaxID=1397476 RepID=A0A7W6KQC6_9HYPH|nr:hemin uptake protein HemP [Martelella radicis]MBB4124028.1 hemin uptake protein HemP [Martelella radicis]
MSDDKTTARAEASENSAPVLQSETLFKGGNEVIIRHQGADYRMKITRQGKLILNK